jgi:hypothetical protein
MKRPDSVDDSLVKSLVKFFANSYRPFVFGAFSKPTTRDVGTALTSNRLAYAHDGGGQGITAAAIFNILEVDLYKTDFSGRRCLIPRGSCYVRHLGALRGRPEAVSTVINQLRTSAPGFKLWIEIHEENRELREYVEKKLNSRYVMTRITASSELRGVYLMRPEVAALPVLRGREIPSLMCLTSDFLSSEDISAIRQELEEFTTVRPPWKQHYSHYNKRNTWTAFSLRGYRPDDPGFIIKPSEMSKRWKSENPELLGATCGDTVIARYFPKSMRAVARIPGGKERIRFMRLAHSKGELSRHADVTDRDAGIRDGCVARLHLPVTTHEDVLFESWGLRGERYQMHMAEGGLYYLDQRKPHRVVNHSPVERIHLVVDIFATAELRKLMDRRASGETFKR